MKAIWAAALGAGLIACLVIVGCQSSDPTAPASSTIDLSANPATIDLSTRLRGNSSLAATVLDADGHPVSGVKVYFSTTSGSLSTGNGGISTSSNGIANTTLTMTRGDADATVKARAPGAGSATATVHVHLPGANLPPVAVATASATTVLAGEEVSFNGTDSSDADGTVVNWKWTFTYPTSSGTTTTIVQGDAATASLVSRSFPNSGTATAKLVVTDDEGATSTNTTGASITVTVLSNYPPTAVISGPTTATVGNAITLDASGSSDSPLDPNGEILRYDWDMGDGTTYDNQTVPTITHTYLTSGAKTVTLKVYDNGDGTGCSTVTNTCHDTQTDTDTRTISVSP